MTATGDGVERSPPDHPPRRTDGGVHFEETISLSDKRYSQLTSRFAPGFTVVSYAAFLLFIPLSFLLFFGFVAEKSGRPMGEIVNAVVTGLSPDFLLFGLLFVVLFVGTILAGGVMTVKSWRSWGRDRVHTRVTDQGIEIDRDGRRLWQSSGVTIPFDVVSSVEYNDPEGDLKVNLGDIRSKKFIGGRAKDWVRIGRDGDPAVYVGSDRPRELAAVVGDLAPNVDGPQPFS